MNFLYVKFEHTFITNYKYIFHLFVCRFGCSKPECSIIPPGFVHPSDVFVSREHATPSWFNWGYTTEPANCFIKNNTGSIEPIFKSHNERSETENITVFYWKCLKLNAWTQLTWTWWPSSVLCWRTLCRHDRDHMECVIRQRSGWTDGSHHISAKETGSRSNQQVRTWTWSQGASW